MSAAYNRQLPKWLRTATSVTAGTLFATDAKVIGL